MFKTSCFAVLIVLVALSHSVPAEACSCAPPMGIGDSLPAEGDEEVPTEVVPWAKGARVHLEDRDGNVVPTRTEFLTNGTAYCVWSQELVPEAPLQPNSVYSIVAEPHGHAYDDGSPTVVLFATGDGPLEADSPETPVMRMAAFDAKEHLTSCVYAQYQACLHTDHEGMLEVRVAGSGNDGRFLGPPSTLQNLLLGSGVGETCVEVRARDLAGELSEPAVHCVNTESLPLLAPNHSMGPSVDCSSSEVMALFDDDSQPEETEDPVDDPQVDDPQVDDPQVDDPQVNDPDSGDVSDPEPTGVKAGSVCSVRALGQAANGTASILVVAVLLLSRRRRARRLLDQLENSEHEPYNHLRDLGSMRRGRRGSVLHGRRELSETRR